MGTRNLTMVIKDKKTKVAQYGQWDGYPDGQGKTILKFLSSKKRIEDLKKCVDNILWVTPEDEAEIDKLGDKWKEKWGHLSRDVASEILNIILETKGKIKLQNQEDFAGESLHNEFSYVLDLDNDILEVYKGFNKNPVPESSRFAKYNEKAKDSMEFGPDTDGGSKYRYYPVKLMKKYPFNDLPTVAVMKAECDPEDN